MESPSVDISVVIPLYNEELMFDQLVQKMDEVIDSCPFSVECILINDGSADRTGELIKELALKNSNYKGLLLSKNFGHQKAISAGFMYAKGTKGVMVIDGDLQDPPELILPWYDLLNDGYDVIYGVRQMRKDEGGFKRSTSKWFYRVLNMMVEEPIPLDSGDFCLMSRRIVNYLNSMPEKYRFIRGMRASLGFKQYAYEYERQKRVAGETKYTLKKMIRLAMDALYGFSEVPYKLMMNSGIALIILATIYLIFSFVKSLFFGGVVSGFLGLLAAIIIIGGINLLGLGILGGYLVRNFFELKSRPLFVVDELIEDGVSKKLQFTEVPKG